MAKLSTGLSVRLNEDPTSGMISPPGTVWDPTIMYNNVAPYAWLYMSWAFTINLNQGALPRKRKVSLDINSYRSVRLETQQKAFMCLLRNHFFQAPLSGFNERNKKPSYSRSDTLERVNSGNEILWAVSSKLCFVPFLLTGTLTPRTPKILREVMTWALHAAGKPDTRIEENLGCCSREKYFNTNLF